MITEKRLYELLRDEFDNYMEPPVSGYYTNKHRENFDVEHFVKTAREDCEIDEYWQAADEDKQEEIAGEVLSWIDVPTDEEWKEIRGCDKFHAWHDGDRDEDF